MTIAMAATYDPDPEDPSRIRLPFELHTCALIPERWERWLAHDPLHMLDRHADALRRLAGLYIDVVSCGQTHGRAGVQDRARADVDVVACREVDRGAGIQRCSRRTGLYIDVVSCVKIYG